MSTAISNAINIANKLALYPFIFLMINAQKIKMIGSTATNADKTMLLKGSMTCVQFILNSLFELTPRKVFNKSIYSEESINQSYKFLLYKWFWKPIIVNFYIKPRFQNPQLTELQILSDSLFV